MNRQPWWSQLVVTGWLLAIATGLAFTDRFEGLVGGIVGGVIVHWLPPQCPDREHGRSTDDG